MKKFKTEYSDVSITYWPCYEAGKIALIFLSIIGTVFIAASLWILSDSATTATRVEIIVAIPLVVIILWILYRFIFRTIYIKIVVSNNGIVYCNNYIASEKQISWEDISAVYFDKESWHGRRSCRIFLKKSTSQAQLKNATCDLVLPVFSVDGQKLLKLIPEYLWKNDPRYIWND